MSASTHKWSLEEAEAQPTMFAYAIQAGEGGPIKIGTSADPWQRLKTLQTANASELRVIAAWRVLFFEEQDIHETFARFRLRGEWFEPAEELVKFVLGAGGDFDDWEEPYPEGFAA